MAINANTVNYVNMQGIKIIIILAIMSTSRGVLKFSSLVIVNTEDDLNIIIRAFHIYTCSWTSELNYGTVAAWESFCACEGHGSQGQGL